MVGEIFGVKIEGNGGKRWCKSNLLEARFLEVYCRSHHIKRSIFSAAFGYVEAAVVAYLRSLYTPVRAYFYSVTPGKVFPLLTVAQLRSLGPEHIARLRIELGRELATLVQPWLRRAVCGSGLPHLSSVSASGISRSTCF